MRRSYSRTRKPNLAKRYPRGSVVDINNILDEVNRGHMAADTVQDQAGVQTGFRINRATSFPEYREGKRWIPCGTGVGGSAVRTVTTIIRRSTAGGGGGTSVHNDLTGKQGGIEPSEFYHFSAARHASLAVFADLTPTRGALIYGKGATAAWDVLALGAANFIPMSDGTDLAFVSKMHPLLSSTWHNDVLTGTVTAGDIIYANATPKLARLAKGTDTHVLTLVSGLPAWAAVGVGGGDLAAHIASAGDPHSLAGYLQVGDNPTLTGIWNFNAAHLRLPTGAAWPTTSLGTGDFFLYRPEPDTDPPDTARLGVYIPANDEEAAAWKYPICRDDDGVATTGSWNFVNLAVAGLSHFAPGNAAQVPVTIRGYAAQSSDLLKIQDSTPTDLLTVSAAGVLTCASPVITGAVPALTVTGALKGGDVYVSKASQGYFYAEAPGDPNKWLRFHHTGGSGTIYCNTGSIHIQPNYAALAYVPIYETFYNGSGSTITTGAIVVCAISAHHITPSTGASQLGLVGIAMGSIPNGQYGSVQVFGTALVACSGTVVVGNVIEASAVAGVGQATAVPTAGGVLGRARGARSGVGSSEISVFISLG